MKEGHDIARIGALIGDPARANMLTVLTSGQALTAGELAGEAGITLQTASSHLSKLEAAGLIRLRKQGRHRCFSLSGGEVGSVLEALMGLASKHGHTRLRTGPRDPALRRARVCYNHLAGELGVDLYQSLEAQHHILERGEAVDLTARGADFLRTFGTEIDLLDRARRPLCRSCLDWSACRTHLAGSLGVALLDRFYGLGWAKRVEGSRVVLFSPQGQRKFLQTFR